MKEGKRERRKIDELQQVKDEENIFEKHYFDELLRMNQVND
jgi:hypothetical protein